MICFLFIIHTLLIFVFVNRLLSIAEETLAEFLSKATGTAVDWVQMPGMKVFFQVTNIDDQAPDLFL